MSQWEMYAQRRIRHDGFEFFMNFGSQELVERFYGGDVRPVRVTEDPDGPYYGWIASADYWDGRYYHGGIPELIQPGRGMFSMQFPYGPEPEQDRGKGRIVRLRVEEVERS